ncbi:MAG: hypothetical protein Unbinned4139contig1000_11 [Prokaryotic dsDNA virus sp.]|nr:MAG: hypothetical protein Unbinned4139contig1000_11 [Prokaryotic dsDNA virus sp.]|tara:strand:- start:8963 stop:9637 length:675 start_codon:yes stop_codon:yes gene_type:complete
MAILYYGNGKCSIEGEDIMGVQIKYRGAITIDDKTSPQFAISEKKNNILIFPIGTGTLDELFDYEGEFRVISVLVADKNGKRVITTIKKVMDFAELLDGFSERITTNSEDLKAGYISGQKFQKTSLKQQILPNLHTNNYKIELYDINGDEYQGNFHIHLADNNAMTGSEHSGDSQDLYYIETKTNKLIPTRNKSLVPRSSKGKKIRTTTISAAPSSGTSTSGGY